LLGDRQRLASERGLVDTEVVAFQQTDIGRNHIAEAQANHIVWHQLGGIDLPPLPVAQHPRFQRELALECLQRVRRLVLLPEADRRVEDQQRQDDDEVIPAAGRCRQHGCNLDHPRDRSPEVAEELDQRADLLLLQCVAAEPGPALGNLGARQPLWWRGLARRESARRCAGGSVDRVEIASVRHVRCIALRS